MDDLVVARNFAITGRGTGVSFVQEPNPWLPWCEHHVRVSTPSGESFEAIAQVEFGRNTDVPGGEVQMMLFPDRTEEDIPVGSRVSILRRAT